MESLDNVRERIEALARRTEHWQQDTRMVERRRRWWRRPWRVAAVAALGLALALPLPVQAKTFRCSAGDVQCLIDAINAANANGQKNTIRLAAGTYTLTAVDNDLNGLPVITSPLIITGRGAETTILERDPSAPAFRLLAVAATGTLTLKRLTLQGGGENFPRVQFPPFAGSGGGISNSGTLTLSHCILTNNETPGAGTRGGGLANEPGGLVTIAHTIFAQNGSGGGGGPLQRRYCDHRSYDLSR